ncbi:hypothetical protein XthCFBP4691_14820 [Xanthomonas theicola]|uniref:Uncharacterized protein n=1 Tax=Xanthomonas theicola TaxID=56464 RepID=A0A2S6ZCI5_9XANT|nr:hypothetical protein XthCFBP4691_14820 [Xanthomonas theicola]
MRGVEQERMADILQQVAGRPLGQRSALEDLRSRQIAGRVAFGVIAFVVAQDVLPGVARLQEERLLLGFRMDHLDADGVGPALGLGLAAAPAGTTTVSRVPS